MTWFWTTLLTLVLTYVLRAWLWSSKNKKLPPGPKGFPIIGSLHLLGKFPHRDLRRLSEKYGPIMHMKLGHVPTIIVSSPQAAELFLKTHDLAFAGRPPCQASEHISYDQKNLALGQYGPYWRNMRKMCTLELLSNRKIGGFKSMRSEEVGLLVAAVREAAGARAAVDLSARAWDVSVDMSCRMVCGKKYAEKDLDEKGFKYVLSEGMHLMAVPNLGDYIPYVRALDLQGLVRRMKKVGKITDGFLEKIIDEHLQVLKEEKDCDDDRHGNHSDDFVDVMLRLMGSEENEYCIERSNIKAIMLDMLAASSDTSATAIEWTLSELIKHPKTMKKLQNEIQQAIGMERTVEEPDLENLEFLDMVIKETMRLHPVAPLLIPHESIEPCTVQGFDIPKGSRVMINLWAIGQDPRVWAEPKEFWPERFEGENDVDIRGTDFRHTPFGAGRRGCPGMQLGLTVVRLLVAQLVHCFDWELPEGMSPEELDMTEEFGLTCPRANHLVAVPTYRLQK